MSRKDLANAIRALSM
ncbi:hypothetical protein CFSAN002073_00901, partial [Salmonella enterica subsp. enterica serovar Heidelberg str. CFSAN002073]